MSTEIMLLRYRFLFSGLAFAEIRRKSSKFYGKPTDNQYNDPGKRNGIKEILPMISQVTFGRLDDPCPVEPDMKD